MNTRVKTAFLACCLSIVGSGQRVHADDSVDTSGNPLQEIVVSATLLRDQPIQAVPASITVLDAATIKAAGLQHFEDLIGLVPNLNWSW